MGDRLFGEGIGRSRFCEGGLGDRVFVRRMVGRSRFGLWRIGRSRFGRGGLGDRVFGERVIG